MFLKYLFYDNHVQNFFHISTWKKYEKLVLLFFGLKKFKYIYILFHFIVNVIINNKLNVTIKRIYKLKSFKTIKF